MAFKGCAVLADVVCSGAVVVVGVLGVVVVVCKLVYWLLIAADGVVRDVGNYSVFFVWFRLWVSLLRVVVPPPPSTARSPSSPSSLPPPPSRPPLSPPPLPPLGVEPDWLCLSCRSFRVGLRCISPC